MLTTNTKMKVYHACVLSTLLYGSEAWTLYSRQEHRLNAFHLRCLRRLLGITWQDRVTNKDVLAQAGISSMFAMLTQRRLRWLGHVCRMDDGRIPKDVLYGELATGSRPTGRPALRYKDVCKRDLRAGGVDPADLETAFSDRVSWRTTVKAGIEEAELMRETRWEERRLRRQQRLHSAPSSTQASTFICSNCSRPCLSRIGLYSLLLSMELTQVQCQLRTSGVPQGTVLGPTVFFLFINDIADSLYSQMRLFADDAIVYRQVGSSDDHQIFQHDLDSLFRMVSHLADGLKCLKMPSSINH